LARSVSCLTRSRHLSSFTYPFAWVYSRWGLSVCDVSDLGQRHGSAVVEVVFGCFIAVFGPRWIRAAYWARCSDRAGPQQLYSSTRHVGANLCVAGPRVVAGCPLVVASLPSHGCKWPNGGRFPASTGCTGELAQRGIRDKFGWWRGEAVSIRTVCLRGAGHREY